MDFFLEVVSQWYELVVFTASMEIYGSAVADKLDNNKEILKRRYYRQVTASTLDLSFSVSICHEKNENGIVKDMRFMFCPLFVLSSSCAALFAGFR